MIVDNAGNRLHTSSVHVGAARSIPTYVRNIPISIHTHSSMQLRYIGNKTWADKAGGGGTGKGRGGGGGGEGRWLEVGTYICS